MKQRNKHIKAFTILEVVISLAIMSIIIAMVYVIFTLLSKQLYQYSDQTEQVNNYNQLHTVLTRDMHNANSILFVNNTLLLLVNNDSLKYTHTNQRLIRTFLKSNDTFLIPIKNFKMTEGATVFQNKTKALNVTYSVFEQDILAVYFKDFGTSNQVNKMFFENGN